MPLRFFSVQVKTPSFAKTKFKLFIQQQLIKLRKTTGDINIIFCNDEYLLQINKQFLQHNYYTDIITFPLSEDPVTISAEIYISTDRVKENALLYADGKNEKSFSPKLAYEKELLRVMFHGILHLLGYRDKTRQQQNAMRKAEEKWLRAYNRFSANLL